MGRVDQARHVPAAGLQVALSLDDDFDRMVFVGLWSTNSIVVGDFTTAGEIWDRHTDTAARDLIPAAECAGRFHCGRYLAAVNEPGARAEFERAAALAHEIDWPLVEHVALSELAGALAAEGELAAARPRLADAIRTWIQAGDLAQLWVTLHHVADFLTNDGDLQRARYVWSQLRDRPGFASQTQRSALQDRFGEPPSTTLTDDEMLVWSRDLAEHLAIS